MRFVVIVRPDHCIVDSNHDGDVVRIISGHVGARAWDDADVNRFHSRGRRMALKRNLEYSNRH